VKLFKVRQSRIKALHWWRGLSSDMKKTMVHNPNVNKTDNLDVEIVGRSSIQVETMFMNWLNWEIKGGSENE
jgi:hypothetical protein